MVDLPFFTHGVFPFLVLICSSPAANPPAKTRSSGIHRAEQTQHWNDESFCSSLAFITSGERRHLISMAHLSAKWGACSSLICQQNIEPAGPFLSCSPPLSETKPLVLTFAALSLFNPLFPINTLSSFNLLSGLILFRLILFPHLFFFSCLILV